MADGLDLPEIVRRTAQANARLYKGWLDLSLEYFRGISEIFGGPVGQGPLSSSPSEEMDAGGGILVLEGEEGATVVGAFLVTNDMGRAITCDLVATSLIDSNGATVAAKTSFQPPRMELQPGEQRVVQIAVVIDGRLTPGMAYNGEISIKGMEGFAVPLVVRRQHKIDAPAEEPAEDPKDRPADNPATRPVAADKTAVNTLKSRRAKQKE